MENYIVQNTDPECDSDMDSSPEETNFLYEFLMETCFSGKRE